MVHGFALLFLLISTSMAGELHKIAFGSCNNQFHAQPLWKDLILEAPDLFIWGGDNIYADTTDPEVIKAGYNLQNENIDYSFFKSMTPIIGTWDDHDFGFNNATGIFSKKMESQNLFLNFIGEPTMSPRRHRNGVYTSYTYGEGNKKIKVILLDNRYFKGLDPKAIMLGETQWQWFEEEMKNSDASLHIIMAGLSVLSPTIPFSDEWADYPGEQGRFIDILDKYRSKRSIVLSGDKHFSSIFKRFGHLEFMSSGMTHTLGKGLRAFVSNKYPNVFFGLSYGLIDIDWEESNPVLSMAIRDRNGKNIFKKIYHWEKESWQERL